MTKPVRSPLVQKMMDRVKKQGDYHEDVPKHWMSDEHGMEHALIKYIESLEANQKPKSKDKGVYLVLMGEDFEGPSEVTVCRSKRAAEKLAGGTLTWVGPIPVGDGSFHKLY